MPPNYSELFTLLTLSHFFSLYVIHVYTAPTDPSTDQSSQDGLEGAKISTIPTLDIPVDGSSSTQPPFPPVSAAALTGEQVGAGVNPAIANMRKNLRDSQALYQKALDQAAMKVSLSLNIFLYICFLFCVVFFVLSFPTRYSMHCTALKPNYVHPSHFGHSQINIFLLTFILSISFNSVGSVSDCRARRNPAVRPQICSVALTAGRHSQEKTKQEERADVQVMTPASWTRTAPTRSARTRTEVCTYPPSTGVRVVILRLDTLFRFVKVRVRHVSFSLLLSSFSQLVLTGDE